MSARGTTSRRVWLLNAGVLTLGLACLFQFQARPAAPEIPETPAVITAMSASVAPESDQAPRARAVSVAQIDGARDPDPRSDDEHPHPITAEHRAIQRELQLIGALNDALDLSDAPAMRELLSHHAREFPADPNDLRAGYTLIADCLDGPDTRVLEAARAYYDRERASTLRRYVRRSCLE